MANPQFPPLKTTIYLLLLALAISFATSARILEEAGPQFPFLPDPIEPSDPLLTDVPDAVPPVDDVAPVPVVTDVAPLPAVTDVAPLPAVADVAPLPAVADVAPLPVVADVAPLPAAPIATPVAASAGVTNPVASASATVAPIDPEHAPLSFYMHDILGGSHPSGRVVTGIIANSGDNGLPFSKSNSQVFPINGGVPLNNINGLVNNNNVPFLVGLNGSPSSTVLQNQGNPNAAINGGNSNLPFVSAGQLPSGLTLQQLMFGSITVVDNELTEGHELGSAVLGKGQGFYLSSSLDGSSHTIALTTMFHGDSHEHVDDTLSFFGVHRTASEVSQIAVIGGTGKYEHAKGYASVETLHAGDQHTTDGVETILHFSVYLTYE